MVQIGLYPHKCKECGKKFEARSEYAYKLHRYKSSDDFEWFCSYKCLREYEKTHSRKKKPTVCEQKYLDLLDTGLTITEVARLKNVNVSFVGRVKHKWR